VRKFWISTTLLVGMVLSACGQQVQVAPAALQPPMASATELVPVTAVPVTNTPTKPAMDSGNAEASSSGNCTVVSGQIEPDPTLTALFPLPTAEDWSIGNPDAKLTLTVYSDFQCPYCSELDPVLAQLAKENPEDVRVIFRHFPLPMHDKAKLAAQAAEAAGKQGKFFEMGAYLFANQSTWATMVISDFEKFLVSAAKLVGLDTAKFEADRKSDEVVKKIDDAQKEGLSKGISGTPFVLINGRDYQGPRDLDSFKSILKLISLEKRQFNKCPEMTINVAKKYSATLKTEKGDIVIQLFADKAPIAVNSFVFLARNGWFDNVTFHRVIPGFVAQTGDPSGTGGGNPGYFFANESSDLKYDKAGVVGMANAGPNTNGSQFFITYGPVSQLDGGYTIFGQVVEGMDIAQKLTSRDPSKDSNLPEGDKILSVSIKEE
jgi:cyclophilin family peptidyl-prolyl cis-trans isomerase/protein-disulfide isomerase